MIGRAQLSEAQVIGGVVSQAEAQRHGLTRAWYAQADVSRMVGEIVDTTLSDGVLFVQTSRARLHAIDAETGALFGAQLLVMIVTLAWFPPRDPTTWQQSIVRRYT